MRSREKEIREAYERRDSANKSELYSWRRPDVRWIEYRNRDAAADLLLEHGVDTLADLRVVDVGCGRGGWLSQLVAWGARPARLTGIDLLRDRVQTARQRWPHINWVQASGWSLPLASGVADLTTAFTLFSSIGSESGRRKLAREFDRVTGADGCMLVYDFCVSRPDNPDTVAIRKREIEELFPGWEVQTRSLTLVPPLARRLATVSVGVVAVLEHLVPLLRTHRMYLLSDREG